MYESMGAIRDVELGRYEVYVVSPQLREGLGLALIDSGSMISLVREPSVVKIKEQREIMNVQGITGAQVKLKGRMNLKIENTLEPLHQECYVVDSLPRNLDIILGQDWLEEAGYSFQKKTPIIIPPYSEQVIKCKTNEKGLLQPGLIVASSLVECKSEEFPCLVVNVTERHINLVTSPKLEKPPTRIQGQGVRQPTTATNTKRSRLLKEKLRLNRVIEVAKEIREICEEYADIFKLPGDTLTATTATEHLIPTPSTQKEGR
jgi:hypothetical protein